MFKLNQNGWGLRVMIAFLCIFVLCLLLSFMGLYKLGLVKDLDFLFGNNNYQNVQNNTPTTNTNNPTTPTTSTMPTVKGKSYADLQFELVEASKKYVSNATLGIDTLVLTVENLKSYNYIEEFKDENGKKCSGYADVYYDENNNIIYNAYIKCKKYQTSGYQEWKDED